MLKASMSIHSTIVIVSSFATNPTNTKKRGNEGDKYEQKGEREKNE